MLPGFNLSDVWLAVIALTPAVYHPSKTQSAAHTSPAARIDAGDHPVRAWMESRNMTPHDVALRMNLHGAPGRDAHDIACMAKTPLAQIAARDLIAFCRVVQITPERLLAHHAKEPAPGSVIEAVLPFLHHAACERFIRAEMSRSCFMETAHDHDATNQQILNAVNKIARVIGQAPKQNLDSPAAYIDDFERRFDAVDRYLSNSNTFHGFVYKRAEPIGGVDLKPFFAWTNKFVIEIPATDARTMYVSGVNAAWLSAFRTWRSHPKTSCFLKSEANRLFLETNAYAVRQLSLYAPTALRVG